MYRFISCSESLPKWLKILLYVLLTLTCVYWIGWLIYKILEVLRLFLHTMTEKKVFWITMGILFICAMTTLCILEFNTDIKPFTTMWEWLSTTFDTTRNALADFISGK